MVEYNSYKIDGSGSSPLSPCWWLNDNPLNSKNHFLTMVDGVTILQALVWYEALKGIVTGLLNPYE